MSDPATTALAPEVQPRRLVPTPRQQSVGITYAQPTFSSFEEVSKEMSGAERVTGFVRQVDPRRIEGPRAPLVVFSLVTLLAGFDDQVFSLILPELRAEFAKSASSVLILGTLVTTITALTSPLAGYLSDRVNRVRMVRLAVIGSNVGNIAAAFSQSFGHLFASRTAGGLIGGIDGPGRATLLLDFYRRDQFAKLFVLLPALAGIAGVAGPTVAGITIRAFGWRLAVLGLGGLATVVSCLTFLLKEPKRGEQDLELLHAPQAPEPPKVGFAEGFRTMVAIGTVRRLWLASPLQVLGASGTGLFLAFYYTERFGLDPAQRGYIASLTGAVAVVFQFLAVPLAGRLTASRPGRVLTYAGFLSVLNAAVILVLIVSPWLALSVAAALPLTIAATLLGPATQMITIQVVPTRVRGLGFTIGNWFALPGQLLFVVLLSGGLGGLSGLGAGRGTSGVAIAFIPCLLLSGYITATAGQFVEVDMRRAIAAAIAEAETVRAEAAGRSKMLVCRGVEVHYDGTQVLFGVDLDVEEGEILALLGTNGAGKSTLLRAISGVQEASNGAIFVDGRDITHEPAHLNAARGVVMMPGGRATFPTLSVRENLRTAGWLYREEPEYVRRRTDEVLDFFPVLRTRLEETAGNLSGGEQQMVALGQAFLMRPRLLMIDELSLGLAPVIVEQLLDILRAIHAQGTTVILVEQSLNVALTIAERAIFMEKGEIRFDGRTEDLLRRPELVRSVFMGGGATGHGVASAGTRSSRVADNRPRAHLELEGVSLSFGGVHALRGVDLAVGAGEIVGIIGPNGAGKTTLFDIVSGFVRPDEGAIVLDGNDISTLGPDARARLGLGRSFQDVKLFPALTVRENIAVALERRAQRSRMLAALWSPQVRQSEARIFRRVDGLIEILGLDAYADKFANELSTGSRRAVEVACMMALEPKILLLDEPSSGLAQAETEELGPVLQRIRREIGCGMLVIEHDMPLITSISDRLVAMELGTVLLSGKPEEVRAHPRVLSSYLSASESVISRSGRMSVIAAALGQPSEPEESE